VVEIPFNDKQAASDAIARHGHEAAAVIVEGIMGSAGMVPPEDGYLHHLRAETERHGMLLILDEVITLRLAEGGAQQYFDVRPDLTAMGKIVGGGFPVGAFGGREEVMLQFSPLRAGGLGHSGTFNGNPVTMAAGLATLRALPQAAIDRINALGDRFAEGVRDAAAERGIRLQVTGVGSLRNLQFSAARVYDAAGAAAADKELIRLLHLALLQRGIFAAPRGMFAVSTPMGEAEVDEAVAAVDDALRTLLPAIAERAPALLA
jgi:glutamate-1-semialdehyde 2,1-aminomutase